MDDMGPETRRDGKVIKSSRRDHSMQLQPLLGQRLRAIRQARGRSLADVASSTDMSPSFLSLVETGKCDITFGRLITLIGTLGVHLSDLVPELKTADAIPIRKEERRHVYSQSEGVELFLLVPDTGRLMMPGIYVFEARGKTIDYAHHLGEEFALVIDGSITLEFRDGETIILETGDSVYFSAERSHIYRNVANRRAQVLTVVTPPSL